MCFYLYKEKAMKIISIKANRKSLPDVSELKAMIKSTKGRFFSAEFIKSDGSRRKIVARIGCHKGVKGTGRKLKKEHLIAVYEPKVKGWRTINLETLQNFKCGNFEFGVE